METRQRILEALSDGRFHSGQVLADSCGITRAAVYKIVSSIRDQLDLKVFSVRGKGYRLAIPIELLNQQRIESALSPVSTKLLDKLEIKTRIDSTNTYLMGQVREGLRSGHVCLAEQQTSGRGRQGRDWISPFGNNIYLSIYWRYDLDLVEISGLSLAAGLAVVKALSDLGIKGVGLKWPNDVLWQKRKLAGLLVEATGEKGGPSSVVLGLGLNCRIEQHQGKMIDQPWADLSQVTLGERVSRNLLAARLIDRLLDELNKFATQGFLPLAKEWHDHDVYYGETITLKLGEDHVVGTHCGVNENGALLLREAGIIKAYHGGEISLRNVNRV